MPAPLIAIPAHRLVPGRVSGWNGWAAIALPEQYVSSVRAAGGRPVLLDAPNDDSPAELLSRFDGLVLSGGGDVDPALYGGQAHPGMYGIDRRRDEFEIELARTARDERVPALMICRGLQVTNVAFGGTLIPDLGDVPELRRHDHPLEDPGLHGVRLKPGSRLRAVAGADEVLGASHHHQAVARLGEGLVEVGWSSDDGLVEALEHETAPITAVQWHCEETAATDPAQAALFTDLVRRAAGRRG